MRPEFRTLDRAECEEILGRNHVGRIAYSFQDRIGIEPISYVFSEGWIYGRTGPGSKLDTIKRNRWVAFEVDEVDGHFDWRSVVAQGRLDLLSRATSAADRESYERALALVRSLHPGALTEDDPTPQRTEIFCIPFPELTGRAASTAG